LLAVSATLLAWAVALPAGLAAGVREGSAIDFLITAGTILLLAIPEVILALFALLLAARLHWLPFAVGPQSRTRLFFPTICLSGTLVPLLTLHVKASIAETARAPFIGTAKGLGISANRVLLRWILPASSNSAISLFGLSLGLLMSSSLIVEGVFSWPGLGQLMLQAISDRDIFLIADSAVIAAGFLLVGNLVADALLYISDPRIRAQ
jgi:ABC-type dipeptide/oligopeptide/nickel transport system permease component